jgi:hypothetical protein
MTTEKRRSFLKGFGIIGAFAAGVSAPVVVKHVKETKVVTAPVPTVDPNVLATLEEQAPATLQLQATYGEVAPPPPPVTSNNGYFVMGSNLGIGTSQERMRLCSDGSTMLLMNQKQFVPGTENTQSVKMVPGPDGELYLNINGQWKKVLTT